VISPSFLTLHSLAFSASLRNSSALVISFGIAYTVS
jgi:hypothetical protein